MTTDLADEAPPTQLEAPGQSNAESFEDSKIATHESSSTGSSGSKTPANDKDEYFAGFDESFRPATSALPLPPVRTSAFHRRVNPLVPLSPLVTQPIKSESGLTLYDMLSGNFPSASTNGHPAAPVTLVPGDPSIVGLSNTTPRSHANGSSNSGASFLEMPPPHVSLDVPNSAGSMDSYPSRISSLAPNRLGVPDSPTPISANSFPAYPQTSSSFAASLAGKSFVTRRVTLTQRGNLQIEVPVPSAILARNVAEKTGREFTHTRYTASIHEPEDFARSDYSLRQTLLERQTEIAVCCTMYNEDPYLFSRSLYAVAENIKVLTKKWGPDAWKKVVVCIISDGRSKIHPGTLEALGAMGVYQQFPMLSEVGTKEVTAQIFEYTSQITLKDKGDGKGIETVETVPIPILFCLKEKNAKKINSHRWFFQAFCPILEPRVCLMLDIGTRPSRNSFLDLWSCFDRHPNVGGACGEIVADLAPGWLGAANFLVASQAFEYKISNQLDKPLESAFGYISVLPGAFSAYRYAALTDVSPGVGPLSAYFRGEAIHSGAETSGILESNVYLAEDRVLCFELIAKPGEAWVLRYVSSATAITDVPDGISELVGQRRRWLNGSTFATIYAIGNWARIYKSNHSIGRKAVMTFQLVYNILSFMFSWFALGNFYLVAFFMLRGAIPAPDKAGPLAFGDAGGTVFSVVTTLYLWALLTQFLLSMGSKPSSTITLYRVMLLLWMGIMGVITYLIAFAAWQIATAAESEITTRGFGYVFMTNPAFSAFFVAAWSCWGIWLIGGVLSLDPWHLIHSILQFWLQTIWWTNVLQVYAYANVHDVSWGTKGDSKAHTLGSAKHVASEDSKDVKEVELELPDENQGDEANRLYQQQLANLAKPAKEEEESRIPSFLARPKTTDQEESFKRYRTVILILWTSTNLLLVLLMTSSEVEAAMIKSSKSLLNPYLVLLFYSTVVFSGIKFLGLLWFVLFQKIFDRRETIEAAHVGNVTAKRPEFKATVSSNMDMSVLSMPQVQ